MTEVTRLAKPVDQLTEWAAERGQVVFVSESAATDFVTMRDPRLGPWDWDDTRLAVSLNRRTLPWLPEPKL